MTSDDAGQQRLHASDVALTCPFSLYVIFPIRTER